MRINSIVISLLLSYPLIAFAQYENGFPFGKYTYAELEMKDYPSDTSAIAVVLNEFGEASIDSAGDNNLVLEYHIKIKVLKKSGVDQGNFSISLYKEGVKKQFVRSVFASTYNLSNGQPKEIKMERSAIFNENYNENWDITKFTLPDVQVGSMLDIKYILESPFIFNFWPWKFQTDIPKMKTEFWARIPANYVYNTTLIGYLDLTKNESTIIKDCFTPGGRKADCSLGKYAMENVPAFVEEDYMTAKSNFIAAINYELSQVKHFDGRVDNYTKSWPDVDSELRTHQEFGVQIKKASKLLEDQLGTVLGAEIDPLKRATLVYQYIQSWYSWNGNYSKYTEDGVKKAFDTKKGNVGDINLSLVGALQSAGLNADPVMLATRTAGVPNEIHPVMSDFNYVVAHVNLGDTKYLLDATEKLLPFGMLPERCLNGKGRLISKDASESGWVELKPLQKQKKSLMVNLKLEEDDAFHGTLIITSFGYEAFDKRTKILSEGLQEYEKEFHNRLSEMSISEYTIENLEDLSKPLIEKMKVETGLSVSNPSTIYLNPFIVERWEANPFKSTLRQYPVDFGAPLETTFLLSLEYPEKFVVEELPANVAVTLPQNGGRCLFNVTNLNNKISMSSIINISKTVYSAGEYHALRELFNRIVQLHQSQVVLKRH
ncbi:MAG: transglutaminase domain-containing protein [Bacteroidia bacterium]|nr:transglutaminase domain-containing protein [Bacteroidia bacterium]